MKNELGGALLQALSHYAREAERGKSADFYRVSGYMHERKYAIPHEYVERHQRIRGDEA